MRLADYVADFLVQHGVTHCFSVVGGGAMYLNDAFGHRDDLKVVYQHHEQACAIAAEAYARLENRIAALMVTSGPGGTNAITGVLGGWLESIPMFVVSGQVRYDTTARYGERFTDGLKLRAVGDQEFDITKAVSALTKYAVMIEDPSTIRYHCERAWHLATTGRPGPVWLDIPVNFQGASIDPDSLPGYDPAEDDALLPPAVCDETAADILAQVRAAERPVFYAGYGIRLSGGYEAFRRLEKVLNIPVVTYWNAIDLVEDDDPLYTGRAGNMGDRPGNFAVQNADLVLSVGTRLSIRQVGYNWQTWARAARVIMVDADPAELKKHTLHVEQPVWADAKDFCEALLRAAERSDTAKNIPAESLPGAGEETPSDPRAVWLAACARWKREYPAVLPRHRAESGRGVNVYYFFRYLSEKLPAGMPAAFANGACCVAGHQTFVIKKGTRVANNSSVASMGYGLPAAIGTCYGAGLVPTLCLEGDGSIMMNLQELQTVAGSRLPIRIFLVNNGGYHSIRLTQGNLFSEHTKVGIGPESGDLSFPRFEEIAKAFGLPYFCAHTNAQMERMVEEALAAEGPLLAEIFMDIDQPWEPKSSARRLPDGSLYSPPLEDLAPFLPREELKRNMFIPLLDE